MAPRMNSTRTRQPSSSRGSSKCARSSSATGNVDTSRTTARAYQAASSVNGDDSFGYRSRNLANDSANSADRTGTSGMNDAFLSLVAARAEAAA